MIHGARHADQRLGCLIPTGMACFSPQKRFAQALLHQGQGYNVRSQISLLFYCSIYEEISRPSKLNKKCSYVDDINKHSAKTYTMYR
jgi:hypothetical protein